MLLRATENDGGPHVARGPLIAYPALGA